MLAVFGGRKQSCRSRVRSVPERQPTLTPICGDDWPCLQHASLCSCELAHFTGKTTSMMSCTAPQRRARHFLVARRVRSVNNSVRSPWAPNRHLRVRLSVTSSHQLNLFTVRLQCYGSRADNGAVSCGHSQGILCAAQSRFRLKCALTTKVTICESVYVNQKCTSCIQLCNQDPATCIPNQRASASECKDERLKGLRIYPYPQSIGLGTRGTSGTRVC